MSINPISFAQPTLYCRGLNSEPNTNVANSDSAKLYVGPPARNVYSKMGGDRLLMTTEIPFAFDSNVWHTVFPDGSGTSQSCWGIATNYPAGTFSSLYALAHNNAVNKAAGAPFSDEDAKNYALIFEGIADGIKRVNNQQ